MTDRERQAEEAFIAGDLERWLGLSGDAPRSDLVLSRAADLRSRGVYEAAAVLAFTMDCESERRASEASILRMFMLADRERLRLAGASHPKGPWQAFRGVCGHGRARRINGFSWSASLNLACWDALKDDAANPAIFYRILEDDELYFFSDRKYQGELICVPCPTPPKRYRIRVEEMRERKVELLERWKAEERAKPTN
jgi:hypothetical protein